MMNDPRLRGARVLIIEDNALSALLAEQTLIELGCVPAATANSVKAALSAIDSNEPLDCVMLDVRLGHELSTDIASKLMKKDIPFIICSGYDIKLPGMNIPVVDKPYTTEALAQALSKAMASPTPMSNQRP
jgi:CheY-like chemotaxis protein